MYNELCEYKDTDWNITYYCITITVYLMELCTGGTTSPTSPSPGCRLLSVSPGTYKHANKQLF